MVIAVSAYNLPRERALAYLYAFMWLRLGEEGTNISHTRVPTWASHELFYDSHPYDQWHILFADKETPVGAAYISKQGEVGIYVAPGYRRRGYAREALKILMDENHGRRLLANINEKNEASIRFFASMGFARVPQITYQHPAPMETGPISDQMPAT